MEDLLILIITFSIFLTFYLFFRILIVLVFKAYTLVLNYWKNRPTQQESIVPKIAAGEAIKPTSDARPPSTGTAIIKFQEYESLDLDAFFTFLNKDRQRRLERKLREFESQNSLAPKFFKPVFQHHPGWIFELNKYQKQWIFDVLTGIDYWKAKKAIRPLESWSPPRLERADQYLDDLVTHLFEQYEVSSFIRSFWRKWKNWPKNVIYSRQKDQVVGIDPRLTSCFFDLYFHMADGGSLRKADFLPFQLSKRAAGWYLHIPDHLLLHPVQAYWWATFMAYGGSSSGWPLLASLEFDLEQEEFWKQFLMLVARQKPDRDLTFAFQIIQLLKFGEGRLAESSVFAPLSGSDPNFSLKGRTIASIENYFVQLTRSAAFQYPQPLHLMGEYYITSQKNEKYRIVLLNSCQALVEESRAMQHCLSDFEEGYHLNALEGHKSYWSLRLQMDNGEEQHLVTFELDEYGIQEISGPENEEPAPEYLNIILDWADQKGFSLAA